MLEGAVFGLYAGEDIVSSGGKVLIVADELIEMKATNKDGKLMFQANLPIDVTYYVKEIQAPAGFVTSEEKQEFTAVYAGGSEKSIQAEFTFENEPTKVEISKQDIAGKELPGAKLSILDENGKVVESWTSTEKPHYIEMLPVGKYTLHEESAPEGYLVAEDVKFEVFDAGELQYVVMVDEAVPEKPETPGKTEPPRSDAPKTGDNTNLMLWMFLFGTGLCGLGASVALKFYRKKNK